MASLKEAERLYQLYLNGEQGGITPEQYQTQIKEAKKALQEAEKSIRDGIAQIGDELENAFDLVDEKLDKQYTKFERLDELMEHYKSVISLTEGEESYASFNKILQTQ
jgi:polyribonucleotide nucleotidyltransferase